MQMRPHHHLVLRAPGDDRVRLGSWTWERTISTPLTVKPPESQSGGGGEKKAVGRGGGVSSQHLMLWALPAPASLRLPPCQLLSQPLPITLSLSVYSSLPIFFLSCYLCPFLFSAPTLHLFSLPV